MVRNGRSWRPANRPNSSSAGSRGLCPTLDGTTWGRVTTGKQRKSRHVEHVDLAGAHQGHNGLAGKVFVRVPSQKNSVIAGIGEMTATTDGFQSRSVVRFIN